MLQLQQHQQQQQQQSYHEGPGVRLLGRAAQERRVSSTTLGVMFVLMLLHLVMGLLPLAQASAVSSSKFEDRAYHH